MTQIPTLSRRNFLKILAISGAATSLSIAHKGDLFSFDVDSLPNVISESHFLMGTIVNLTLVSDDPVRAKATSAACMQEVQRLVHLLSRFEPGSQLSQLNAEGVYHHPDPILVDVIRQALLISRASDGAFDISIKPLLDLYQTYLAQNRGLPSRQEIGWQCSKVDYRKIICDEGEIHLSARGMGLTLDGIAKGAVIDAGIGILRSNGFRDVIVEAGGDLLASGERSLARPWKIGIRRPRPGSAIVLPTLSIQNQAVATSGDYFQTFTQDYSVNHILDPRRGVSSSELASATIIAPSAALADGLATAVMVLGIRDGLELVKQFPDCEAYLIDKKLQTAFTPGIVALISNQD